MAVGFRRDGKTTEAFGLQEENAWASDPQLSRPLLIICLTKIQGTCTAMPISKLLSFMTAPEI
jgi:hypothetical protein